jgi:hypothetical protein
MAEAAVLPNDIHHDSEVTLAMVAGVGPGMLGRTIHPYPTQAGAIRKTADRYYRTRLTPFVKTLFQKRFAVVCLDPVMTARPVSSLNSRGGPALVLSHPSRHGIL